MARVRFLQADVARAVKATICAGVTIERIEISQDGKISIFPITGLEKKDEPASLDAWRAANGPR
jgi:hypothetical protein